jgi:uncharacterized protein YlzI (FlbEa/FlbD family)
MPTKTKKLVTLQEKVEAHLAAELAGAEAYSHKDRILAQIRAQMKRTKTSVIEMSNGAKYVVVDNFREANKKARENKERPMPAVGKYVMISRYSLKEA